MTAKRTIILSLLLDLLAGCVVMWVRSYWRMDVVGGSRICIVSNWGGLQVVHLSGASELFERGFRSDRAEQWPFPFGPSNGGFAMGSAPVTDITARLTLSWFGLPWWLLAMVPLFFAWRLRRRWRREAGRGFEPIMGEEATTP